MEGNSNNNNTDKHKTRPSFSENNSSRDGCSSNNGNQWPESHREHRREHGKNRERSRDPEWNRERTYHGKRENFRDEESRDRFREEQPQHPQPVPQQSATFSSYGYNNSNYNPPDNPFVDNNGRALTLMSSYNTFLAAMNSPWGVGSMDGMTMPQNNIPVNPSSSGMPMSSNIEMAQNTTNSGMNPYAYMGMSGESNMYGMVGMGNYCQYGMMNVPENIMVSSVKEILHLTKSVLYPPNPNAPPPTTRGKPLGCKTVFVGGLPEKITEEIIREVFDRCGEIQTVRMSKKNFCHIRFSEEMYVENALFFSGYRIKIENKDEAPFTGRLHVDYAQARDDEREYYEELRKKEREIRHGRRAEEYSRPNTPISHYTDHEGGLVSEKLRNEETFQQALCILITWLDRGECNKKTCGSFYSMIQSTNSHVRRLISEKAKYEDELNKAKLELKQQMQGILVQFNEIQKVFTAACTQKVWDHFTKPQRKNIEMWKKQIEEIRNAHIEEVLNERSEDEMDMSDDDMNDNNSDLKLHDSALEQQKIKLEESVSKLQEEIDALRCQLEAAENEKMVMKSELLEKEQNERRLINMNHSLQNMKKNMVTQKWGKDESELKELCPHKKRNLDVDDDHQDCKNDPSEAENADLGLGTSISSTSSVSIIENDARLIGLISTFLNVHPMGASIDYICSYLCQIDRFVNVRDVESLMRRFSNVFKEESTGIGASLEKKWTFCGFMTRF